MISAAIIGASGYSGAELLRLLSMRDDVRIVKVTANSSVGKRVTELYPAFSGSIDLEFESFDAGQYKQADVVFIALPSGEAMNIVPQIAGSVDRIIDLGGDFRLQDASLYQKFYAHEHTAPHLLADAVYGLPELNYGAIAGAKFIANPGCYPTSAILALLPALKYGIIEPEGIVINALSGISGAGRSASFDLSFAEINENTRAYKIGRHQHIPEIQSVLEQASDKNISLSFVPHLIPVTRGIYTTIHANLNGSFTDPEIFDSYEKFYHNAPFIRLRRQIPQIKHVVGTNFCDLFTVIEPRTNQLIIVSVIDNLIKGAAGQAIQNMNIMFGLDQTKGLR